VEHDAAEIERVRQELHHAGLDVELDAVATLAGFTAKLQAGSYDVVLAGLHLPPAAGCDGMEALRALKQNPQWCEIPFVLVTESLDQETAIQCLRQGVADCVLKDRLAQLPPAVRRAQQQRALRETQRRAEAALRDGESRLRTIIETEPECVKVLSPDAIILEMNAAGLAMIEAGASAQVMGQSCMGVIAEEHRMPYRALIDRVIRGERGQLEFEIVGLRGTRRWLETHAAPLRNAYGYPVCMLAVTRDISEKKRHEIALRLSEEKFAKAFRSSPEAITLSTIEEGRVLEVNDGFLRMSGYAREEVIGRTVFELRIWGDLSVRDKMLAELRQHGSVRNLEIEFRTKSGTTLVGEFSAELIELAGVSYLLAITRDISHRRRAEQVLRDSELRYRTLFEHNLAGVFRSTIAGHLVDCNSAFASIFGYTREDMLARPAYDFYFDRSERDAFVKLLFEHGSLSNFELRLRRKDGQPVWVLENVSVLADSSGQPAFIEGTLIDISERKEAEEQVRLQAAALEAAANQIIITDPDGKILWVNPAFTRQTGYSSAAVIGQNPRILKSGIHPASFYEKMWKAIRTGQVWSGEITNRRKDGTLFTDEMTITPVRGSSGKISYFVAIKQDITERKRAEIMLAGEKRALEKIARGENLLNVLETLTRSSEEIVPGMKGLFLLMDSDGPEGSGHLRNPVGPDLPEAYRRAVDGMRIGPAAGSCGTAAFRKQPVIVEDTQIDPLWADFRELAAAHDLRACWSTPILSAKGDVLGTFAMYHREPRRPTPQEWQAIERICYLAGIAISRSRSEEATRESEARYRNFVENATYGIYRSSQDGRFLQVNPALVRILGYDSPEELLALNLDRDVYYHPADRSALLDRHLRENRIAGVEVEWKRKDGKTILVRLSGRQMRDPQGNIREFEAIAEDITERRAAEQQLRMAQKYEAIGQLAGGIAHDFNNVIGAVMGWADLALEECPPESPIRGRLEKIRAQADRAAALTKQLLAFARRQMLEPRVVNLNEIVAEVSSLLDKVIGKDIELKTRLAPELHATRADPTQIEQVLMNLCLNARDAMPKGGTLVIETSNFDVDAVYTSHYPYARLGRYAVLSVSDTGVGMDAKVLEHVFEPFFTTKKLGKGTGLGLATVYGIVKQHGGFINVCSELGHGSTFKAYLPAVEAPVSEHKLPEVSEPARGGTETILVAEDHTGISAMARELLERLGYRVLLAGDGEEAVRLFQQEKEQIALALLDVVMPKLSGPEAYTRMCAIRSELPVIFATGYSAESAPLLGKLAEKGVTILQKPYSPRVLARRIRELLDDQR
jgi:PAS domain S-box-containing protein